MKKIEEKEPDGRKKSKETLTRRQAIKRIAMSAGAGIATIVLGAKGAEASKHCCIEAYPDYNYGDSYHNYYSNTYQNYSYSNYDNYRNHYVVYSSPGLGYINYSDGHDK